MYTTPLQQFQFYDKYSRWNLARGQRESWPETVRRAVNFLRELSDNKLDDKIYTEIFDAIYQMDVMPSMRLLAMAGAAGRRDNTVLYNCAFAGIDSLEIFRDAINIMMSGCGFGFSVESKYIEQLPEVPAELKSTDRIIAVADSAPGWANAFYSLLESLYAGDLVTEIDYSQVRPSGEVLKVKGGRASGPAPLKDLMEYTLEVFQGAVGRKLNSVEVYDIITKMASCIISGGVRRVATICLFDFDDQAMRSAKDDEGILGNGTWEKPERPHRWAANNSAVIKGRLNREDISELMDTMHATMRGEPGIFSEWAAVNTMPEVRKDWQGGWGTNPCFTGDTKVAVADGRGTVTFKELAEEGLDVPVLALDEKGSVVVRKMRNPRKTGSLMPVYRVTLDNGQSFRATGNHKMYSATGEEVAVEDLQPGDSLFAITRKQEGYVSSKGNAAEYLFIHNNGKRVAEHRLISSYFNKHPKYTRGSQVHHYETVYEEGVLKIIKCCEGCNQEFTTALTTREVSFCSNKCFTNSDLNKSYKHKRAEALRSSLAKRSEQLKQAQLRIYSDLKYSLNREPKKAEWASACKAYGVGAEIARDSSPFRYWADLKTASLSYNHRVVSIELAGFEDVYNGTVDDYHNFFVGGFSEVDGSEGFLLTRNCGEIVLRHKQFCNLSAAIARHDDTYASLKRKVILASIIGTIQSSATYFPYLSQGWQENAEAERLLGVDITGQYDTEYGVLSSYNLGRLKRQAEATNKTYAALLGINESHAVTCCKPSGNSSVLVDCASGIHPRHSKYYIRRARLNVNSPIFKLLNDSGVPLTPENGQDAESATTWVVSFPVKSPGHTFKRDLSALDFLSNWKKNKLHWTAHNPSATCSYWPEELEQIKDWLFENQAIVGGVSFLPQSDYKYDQAPYEEIDEATYYRLLDEMPEVDYSRLVEFEFNDMTEASQELACVAGNCEI